MMRYLNINLFGWRIMFMLFSRMCVCVCVCVYVCVCVLILLNNINIMRHLNM